MTENNNFLKNFELKGDGTGFWDEYKRKDIWLEKSVYISIAVRSMSNDIPILLKQMMENQSTYDRAWKKFAAQKLLTELRREWNIDELDEEFVINKLQVSVISFGFDKEAAFCVWFCTPNVSSEHGVQIYGDIQGEIIRAGIE